MARNGHEGAGTTTWAALACVTVRPGHQDTSVTSLDGERNMRVFPKLLPPAGNTHEK